MQLENLTKILQENGIVGAGGAGFPAYAKLNKNTDTVILNCAECEPLFKVDTQLLEKYAFEIVSALSMVADSVEADNAIIGIKPSYKDAVEAVKAAMEFFPKVSVSYLPEMYPAGDEIILIYETTGRIVKPGNLPVSVGVTVFNVETMLNIYRAVNKNKSVTHKYVMVAGEVKEPKVLKVPLGMSFLELVKICGGPQIENPVYLAGGPMTGRIGSSKDLVSKTTNAVILLPHNHYIVQKKTVKSNIGIKRAMSACCSCHTCTDLCSRNLLGYPINPQAFMRGISQNKVFDSKPFLDTFFCSQCGLCEMYSCMQGLSPASLIGEYKNNLKKNKVTMPEVKESVVSDKREYRMVPVSRLLKRIGLTKYNVKTPLTEEEINPEKVILPLNQNIGAPSVCVVKEEDVVNEGQLIAKAPEGKLGVALHSPVDGKIIKTSENFVIIERIRM